MTKAQHLKFLRDQLREAKETVRITEAAIRDAESMTDSEWAKQRGDRLLPV